MSKLHEMAEEARKRDPLRAQFAAAALTGLLAGEQVLTAEDIAQSAWGLTDAMIEERDA